MAPVWFLLVPYFWVKSWNARPWFGEDREFANHLNGLILVALAISMIAASILFAIGNGDFAYNGLLDVGLYAGAVAAMGAWLNKQRRQHFAIIYKAMSVRARVAFGLPLLALLVWAIWQAPVERQRSTADHPSCPSGAQEITAACS